MRMKLSNYWVEALAAVAILVFNEFAILILYLYLVVRLTLIYEFLRKLIRTYQVANETKILAIIKKLNISNHEISEVMEKELSKLTPQQKAQLEKDVADIFRFS